MNQSMIVKPYLDKARVDLEDAVDALGTSWTADDHDAIARLTNAGEGLARAAASLALAIERLAELVVD